MLTLASPWWLLALAGAVAAPLLAHLLSRRGGVLAGFPAVRFVEQAVADVARLHRPRHWLLLLLRIGALVLVVLAFTDPRWLTAAPVTGDAGLRVAVVVDNSASMQRAALGQTLFDRARSQADDLLRSLDPARDRAVVVLAEAHPHPLLAEPSANFTELITRLAAAEPTLQRGDLAAAVDRAAQQLTATDAGPVRVVLFTDAQRTLMPTAALERLRARGVTFDVHTLGHDEPNVAVHDARLYPTQPVAGQPALLHARVANFAANPRTVTLHCGPQSQRLTLQPYRETDAAFEVQFDSPGQTPVGVTLDSDDALPFDNTAGLVADVIPARPVTLVTRADTMNPRKGVYFVVRALSPSPDGRDAGIALTILQTDQLAQQHTQPGGVWVLVNAGPVDAATRTAMTRHVEAGGGVLWIIDSPDAADSVAQWDASPIAQPLWSDAPVSNLVGRFDDAVLTVFEGPGRSTLLDHTFTHAARGTLVPQATALLTADGAPLLATTWRGGGRVALFAADVSPSSTGFTKSPAWPALLHQLVRHLAPGSTPAPPLHPGDALPDGAIAQTTGRVGDVWVELHPDESDLRVADDTTHETAASQSTSGGLRPRERALWPWLMMLALVLLACETLAAWVYDPGVKRA